jgi:hypothetical protein
MTKQRILTIGMIVLGVLVVVFFGIRTMRSFKHMHGRDPFDGELFDGKPPAAKQIDTTLIRDWMTVPYIAKTYGVSPDAIFKSLEIPAEKKNGKKSLKELNDEFYPDEPGVVLLQVQTAIQAFQKQDPPPPMPPTAPTPNPAPTAIP